MIAPRRRNPYPENISLSRLLLVEGETPTHFFEALAVHLGINKTIEIRSFGGNENLQNFLAAIVKSHGFAATVQSLGIIRDAELDPAAAKQSVEFTITNAKLPAQIKRSIYILPDNARPGMIETLCLESISHQPHYPFIEEFIEKARGSGAAFPGALAIDKCRLQIYMAAHPEPQMMPGIAASRGFWPFTDPRFLPLAEFLKSL